MNLDLDLPYFKDYENDIGEFVTAVKASLQFWLDIHTDATTWAAFWLSIYDGDPIGAYDTSHNLDNSYFTFDWQKAVLKRSIKEAELVRCPKCNFIMFDEWWGDHVDEEHPKKPNLEPKKIGKKWREDAIWFLKDIDYTPTAEVLIEAMIEDGFQVYSEGVADVICGTVDEIQNLLAEFDTAETKADLWLITMKMLDVYHVKGQIIEDYAGYVGLDYEFAYNVRENGGAEMFGEDVFGEWLNS